MSAIARTLTLGLLGLSAAALSALILRALITAEQMDALHQALPFG